MQDCTEVSHEILRMLGLDFTETVEADPQEDRPLTFEMVIVQVCADLAGITAARAAS